MDKKIIEFTKVGQYCKCLLCGKMGAEVRMTIHRSIYDDCVASFHICDDCLSQTRQEMQDGCD